MNFQDQDWDDTEIMRLFESAVGSHKTSSGISADRKEETEKAVPVAKKYKSNYSKHQFEEKQLLDSAKYDMASETASYPSATVPFCDPPRLYPANDKLQDAFNDMLLAWYNSGYATGRYSVLYEQQQQISLGSTPQNTK